MLVIVIIAVIILLIILFKLRIKRLKLDHLTLVSGSLKTGKSALSLGLAIKEYNKNLRKWKIKRFFTEKVLHKEFTTEKPLFYSNIPVGIDYVPLTFDIIERKKRMAYKSICFIDEVSLLADSMSAFQRDKKSKEEISTFNDVLLVFIKLYCHETHNGSLYINTQSISDLHYSFRRCMSRYVYIQSSINWLPFIRIMRVSELFYSEDNSAINTNTGDIEDNTRLLFQRKKIFKKYDRWCYSSFTDSLDKLDNVIKGGFLEDLKAEYVLTNRKLPTIYNEPTFTKKYKKEKKSGLLKKLFGSARVFKGGKKNDKKEIK